MGRGGKGGDKRKESKAEKRGRSERFEFPPTDLQLARRVAKEVRTVSPGY